MASTERFRRLLALRLLGIVGVASMTLPPACASNSATGTSSTTGDGTTTTTTGMGGAGTTTTTTGTRSNSTSGVGGSFLAGTGGSLFGDGGQMTDGIASIVDTVCFDWPLPLPPIDAGATDGGGSGAGGGGADAGSGSGAGGGPVDAGPPPACPTDQATIILDYTNNMCPSTGWDPVMILSPPTFVNGQCCYMAQLQLCSLGGRPYLVDGSAQVAAVEHGGPRGWAEGARPSLAGLTAEDRAALAQAWAADGLTEHASVASFSRFSLALLAAGAPAHLLELAHRAALDEIDHARLCFALASAYAGEAVAPGPFPLGGPVEVGAGLADLAASTVREGCVGETVAAVVAAEQLARAEDPAVRAALARIAADEARHAELAWKTVAWAVRAGGSEVRAAVERAFAEALGGFSVEAVSAATSEAMQAHGRLDAATLAAAVRSAKAEIVAPSARALLAREPAVTSPAAAPRAP